MRVAIFVRLQSPRFFLKHDFRSSRTGGRRLDEPEKTR